MRKLILLTFAIVVACSTALAADVDLTKAQSAAKSFMSKQVANGRLKASAANNLKLVKAETSVAKPTAVDYYIFNADKAYVVVAGDDQAPEILMYGEEGTIDINNVPPAMQWLLNKYKFQIDGLKAGTLKPNGYTPKATTAVAPLTNANWDQNAPYWNHTPTSGGTHTYTGCPATSLSMCFYIYKWPTTYPALPKVQVSGGVTAPALSEKAAEWSNIIDEYTGPTNYSASDEQKDAVAWLMRYVGQACNMQYTTSGSGAYDPDILEACHTFGYTDARLLTLTTGYAGYNQNYTDAQWNTWMLEELHAGRPIEYLASDPSAGGHAFNVFGCDSNGKYYVNWGWSGEDNGYCTLHNFTTGNNSTGQGGGSYTFNYGEAMIIGIAPPSGALGPQITVNPASLTFEGYVGDTYTKTFTVKGYNLEGNITITKQGSNNITVSPTSITASNASNGVEVTVTYKPTATGNSNATITLASTNAESVTVNVTGTAEAKVPTITVDPTSLNINANLSSTVTKTINVTGLFLTNNITVTLNDNNNVFSVTPTTITAANAANGVPVTVSFNSANEGNFTGSITFTSNGAESKTVQLTASAAEGGNASDAYLNIAKYETIGEAGATVSGMSNIYKYTEYSTDACAWLTVCNYGALQADANQNWLETTGLKSYSNTWTASDIFLGDDAYFGSNTSYSIYSTGSQTFYVTNCTQAKAFVKGGGYSSSNATLAIYECTLNADGTLTASTTATDTKQGSSGVITSAALDASKIYKVVLTGGGSYPDLLEIGFKTELNAVGVPTITSVDPTSTTADVTWISGENNSSWNLRYREYVNNEENYHFWDFEDAEAGLTPFTVVDKDGDGFNWTYFNNTGLETGRMIAHGGEGLIASASYDKQTQTALTPNNWLISPEVTLGGSLKFWAMGQDEEYSAEKFGVYVTVDGTNYTQIGDDKTATDEYVEYEFDLTPYAGQTGKFAIVHYNVTDMFWLNIDDIEITPPEGDWIYVNYVESPYTITGLTPETTYEVQVQGLNDISTSAWTPSTIFTTLALEEKTLAELCASGKDGNEYTISNTNGLLGVYKQGTSIWFKDENGEAVDKQTPGANDKFYVVVEKDLGINKSEADFDQSNWIEVVLPDAATDYTEAYVKNLIGIFSKENGNPKLVLTKAVEEANVTKLTNPSDAYTPNPYIGANFIGSQVYNSSTYFFSMPKAQEYAKILWAVWDGEKMNNPENTYGFKGSFTIDPALNSKDFSTLQIGKAYNFEAIIRKVVSGAKASGDSYKVYPLNLNGGVYTAINGVFSDVNGEVVGVEYVNSLGVVSKRPFSGINIVVTRYSDGSATTVKKVFK